MVAQFGDWLQPEAEDHRLSCVKGHEERAGRVIVWQFLVISTVNRAYGILECHFGSIQG